jgi:hypothetical protein
MDVAWIASCVDDSELHWVDCVTYAQSMKTLFLGITPVYMCKTQMVILVFNT